MGTLDPSPVWETRTTSLVGFAAEQKVALGTETEVLRYKCMRSSWQPEGDRGSYGGRASASGTCGRMVPVLRESRVPNDRKRSESQFAGVFGRTGRL
jgi:hypothetical protein